MSLTTSMERLEEYAKGKSPVTEQEKLQAQQDKEDAKIYPGKSSWGRKPNKTSLI